MKNDKTNELRVNEEIVAKKVRIVGEGIEQRIVNIEDALNLSEEMGLDLVEISPNSDPPVCKIIDYSKFKFEQKKHREKIRLNAKKEIIKEVKLSPKMAIGDFNTKLLTTRKFLEQKKSVKLNMVFRGRNIRYKTEGVELMDNFIKKLSDIGVMEFKPKAEGRNYFTLIRHL